MDCDPQEDAAVDGEQFISQKNIIGIPALPELWDRDGNVRQHPYGKCDQDYGSYQRDDSDHCSMLAQELVGAPTSTLIADLESRGLRSSYHEEYLCAIRRGSGGRGSDKSGSA